MTVPTHDDTNHRHVTELQRNLRTVVRGQSEVVEQLCCAFICGGHVLLEGVPGVAKTLLARSLALLSGLTFKRIQFTSDLLPSDIIGTRIFLPSEGQFRFIRGPLFTEVLLADEINRTPPKTQAALLEAMEERQVTVEGELHALASTFFVVATQNPVEYEGTYPLPEAQTDRFMVKILLGYPDAEEELTMLRRHDEGFDPRDLAQALPAALLNESILMAIRADVRAVRIEEGVLRYLHALTAASRQARPVLLGASPRAAIALLLASKGHAYLAGRDYVIPDDVKAMTPPVLRHRLLIRPEAEMDGITPSSVIEDLLVATPIPR